MSDTLIETYRGFEIRLDKNERVYVKQADEGGEKQSSSEASKWRDNFTQNKVPFNPLYAVITIMHRMIDKQIEDNKPKETQ